MKNLYFFLSVFLLFLLPKSLIAQVQVGAGNDNTASLPITSCWEYSYTQQIYLSSEINASGFITHVSFYYVSGGPATNSLGWTIYLGHTTKSSFASVTDWEAVGNLSQVFSGNVSYPASEGWMTITLNTPFAYNGTGNLLVAVDENQPGYNCSVNFRGFSATNRGIHYRSDTINPDPGSPPTASGRQSRIPNIILGGISQTCPMPSALTATGTTSSSAILSWTQTGNAASWDIEYGIQGFTPTGIPTVPGITTNPYNLTGLTSGTNYSFYVRANCGANGLSSWVGPQSFITQQACGGPFYDTGGPMANYSNNQDITWTIVPNVVGEVVTVTFTAFDTEANYDALYIYDGPDISSPQIASANGAGNVPGAVAGGFWGTTIPGPYTSTHSSGALTFRFRSDGVATRAGWESNITCGAPPTCPAPTGLNVSNITGVSADLAWNDITNATSGFQWFVYANGANPNTTTPVASGTTAVGILTTTATGLSSSTTYNFYLQANCGTFGTSSLTGPVTFETTVLPPACGGPFYDAGGSTGNYSNNEDITWTIIPDVAGEVVTVTFTAFNSEASYDALYVYDGPDTNSQQISSANGSGFVPGGVAGGYWGTTIPGPFTSTHSSGALTFRFRSDGSGIRAGWEAHVTCSALGAGDNIMEGFRIYPNPAKDIVNISGQDTIETVVLYNMVGQIVKEVKIDASSSQIDISNLAAGVYLMKVKSNGQIGVYRIVKK